VYRESLTLPKLLVNGTNDPYWPQEALNQYWDDLKGEKYIAYIPNAGHNLVEVGPDGKRPAIPLPTRAVNALSAFSRQVIAGKPMPKLTWKHSDEGGQAYLAVESDVPIQEVRLWASASATRDFRKSRWEIAATARTNVLKTGLATAFPADGYKAVYGECEYDLDGLTYSLSTQIRVLEAKK
jgi:PhoPQ-activated pathogenicity-related protein